MSGAVTTGLFTLLGVIVGGLLNFVVMAAIEERRGRKALRTTARIIGEEIATNNAILTATLAIGDWSPMGNAPLKFSAWQDYRHVLAERLWDSEWETLRNGLSQAQMMDRVHKLGGGDRPFTPSDHSHLIEAQDAVSRATAMLHRYSFSERRAKETGPGDAQGGPGPKP